MYYKNPHGEYVFRDGYFELELDLKDVPVQTELPFEDTMPHLTERIRKRYHGKTLEEWEERYANIMNEDLTDQEWQERYNNISRGMTEEL